MFTRDDPLEDSSPGGSDLMGGASGSSIGDGVVVSGSTLDVVEGSPIPDEDIVASDISIGKDECKCHRQKCALKVLQWMLCVTFTLREGEASPRT